MVNPCQLIQAFTWNQVDRTSSAAVSQHELFCPICRAPLTDVEVAQLLEGTPAAGWGSAVSVACCRSCQYQIVGGESERSPAMDGSAGVAESTAAFQTLVPMAVHVRSDVLREAIRRPDVMSVGGQSSEGADNLRAQIEEWLL